ncbi:MAG: HIT family protein [Geobacteraceae bacterium]|nr:HIT family protein [Geobacteraceae bacterium]
MMEWEGEGARGEGGRKGCRFCAIIRGETPARVVFADAVSLAFLDHRPLFPGHLLLVPREHHETLGDLPEELVAPLFTTARFLARAVEEGMAAEGSFVAVNNRVSQSVPHLHVHIVPRRRHDGLKGFFWPRHKYGDEAEIVQVAALLRATIERLTKGGGG